MEKVMWRPFYYYYSPTYKLFWFRVYGVGLGIQWGFVPFSVRFQTKKVLKLGNVYIEFLRRYEA